MGHLDVNTVNFVLPDGRPLLSDVSLRVGEGAKVALIGPNGTGKTTLGRIIAGDLAAHDGAVTRSGGLGVMRQFVGSVRDDSTVRDLLLSVAPEPLRQAAAEIDRTELLMMERDSEADQMAYAHALVGWGDAGGYDYETLWDVCTVAALGMPFDKAQWRKVSTLSGGEQKRVVLEALLRGPEEVLLLDEPDNYLDVPAKRWLEDQLIALAQDGAVRQPRPRAAQPGGHPRRHARAGRGGLHAVGAPGAASRRTTRRGRTGTPGSRSCAGAGTRSTQKLKDLVQMLKVKAKYNDGMAPRYQAAQTRLRKFEEAGPPAGDPAAAERHHAAHRRSHGQAGRHRRARRAHRADEAVRPRGLVRRARRRARAATAPASRTSCGCVAAGGTDPDAEHRPVGDVRPAPVTHTGRLRLGSRVRPGWFAQTHDQPALVGRTLLEILHRGDEHRTGRPREEAARVLDRYGLARASEQTFESLSGGQQARFQILLLELSGATCLLLDEPTDNLDLHSAEALEDGLAAFEGTVIAVTHDRWFARGFDRFLVFGSDGRVYEARRAGLGRGAGPAGPLTSVSASGTARTVIHCLGYPLCRSTRTVLSWRDPSPSLLPSVALPSCSQGWGCRWPPDRPRRPTRRLGRPPSRARCSPSWGAPADWAATARPPTSTQVGNTHGLRQGLRRPGGQLRVQGRHQPLLGRELRRRRRRGRRRHPARPQGPGHARVLLRRRDPPGRHRGRRDLSGPATSADRGVCR